MDGRYTSGDGQSGNLGRIEMTDEVLESIKRDAFDRWDGAPIVQLVGDYRVQIGANRLLADKCAELERERDAALADRDRVLNGEVDAQMRSE